MARNVTAKQIVAVKGQPLPHELRYRTAPAFEVLEGDHPDQWTIRTKDAIDGDEPYFACPLESGSKAKGTKRPVTLDEVCRCGFRELNEGRGVLTLTEWRSGMPVYVAVVAAWPQWGSRTARGKTGAVPIFRALRSTDPERTARELPWHEPPSRFVGNTQWGLASRRDVCEEAA